MHGWFAGYDAFHAVFLLVVDRPEMLVILVGMDQKDGDPARYSGMCKTGIAGCMRRLCSLFLSSGPRCSASWLVWITRTVTRRVLFKVVDILVLTQRPFPMVHTVWRTIEISQLFLDKVVDVPGVQVAQDSCAVVEETVEISQVPVAVLS